MKRRITASVTDRGQVTIPAEVRTLLGARARGKIVFEIDDDEVRVLSGPMTLAETAGSVKPLHQPEDFKAVERAAKEEHVARVLGKMAEN